MLMIVYSARSLKADLYWRKGSSEILYKYIITNWPGKRSCLINYNQTLGGNQGWREPTTAVLGSWSDVNAIHHTVPIITQRYNSGYRDPLFTAVVETQDLWKSEKLKPITNELIPYNYL